MAGPVLVDPTVASRLFVTWLDEDGLGVMDGTEPDYHRVTHHMIPGPHLIAAAPGRLGADGG
jgi:hypothetical protein